MVMKVLICGGGNGAHVMAAITSSQPDCEARVLTLFADEAERWTNVMKDNEFKLTRHSTGKDTEVISSKPTIVTKNPAEVAPGCDLIVFVVPAFAHHGYLEALKPFIKPGMILAGVPGQAGFEFEVRGVLGDLGRQITLMSFESLPWACRILEFGKHAEVLGTKGSLLGAVQVGTTPPPRDATQMLQQSLGEFPKLITKGHILGIALMGTNGYLHPSILYGHWYNWDGKPIDESPLFYHGIDKFSADLLSGCSDEVLAIAQKIMQLRPQVDMSNVQHIYQWYLRCYDKEITDKTNLETAIRTNQAYKGLTHPVKKNPDGKLVPDFAYRYCTEDIPYGLGVMRGVASVVGVETPNMDRIILWTQAHLGKEFIAKDGTMTGKDLDKTRCPQRYGLTDVDKLLGLA